MVCVVNRSNFGQNIRFLQFQVLLRSLCTVYETGKNEFSVSFYSCLICGRSRIGIFYSYNQCSASSYNIWDLSCDSLAFSM